MPRGDGTGPRGLGPMTGKAAGYCAGYPVAGFMNPYTGRPGLGFGYGRGFGRGMGRGYGRAYWPANFYKSEIQAIKELLPKVKKSIEIGVGSGRFAVPLGIKTGVDPSPRMREIAQQKGIKVIDAVAEELPFESSQFELVLMVTTICFVDNLNLAFREAYRILKLGGYLITGFVDKDSSLGKLYQQRKEKSLFYKIATFYSTKEVVYNLSKVGFKEFDFRQTIFHSLNEIKDVETTKKDYGEGSFVVIRARK